MSSPVEDAWQKGKKNELRFWRGQVETGGGEWSAEWSERLDPRRPLQGYITKYLDPHAARVRILDVGAGPLTIVGKTWDGHEVEVVAVDALADDYRGLLEAQGVVPPVPTLQCRTEELGDMFAAGSFDLVHARNTLDHGLDPLAAFEQMLGVVKVGGALVTAHFANEGQDGNYEGMHQWNFTIEGGDLVVWNPRMRQGVGAHLAGRARIAEIPADGESWCHVVLIREA